MYKQLHFDFIHEIALLKTWTSSTSSTSSSGGAITIEYMVYWER